MMPTKTCNKPCHPEHPCEECVSYWDRMRSEGFWVDGKGWTETANREWSK